MVVALHLCASVKHKPDLDFNEEDSSHNHRVQLVVVCARNSKHRQAFRLARLAFGDCRATYNPCVAGAFSVALEVERFAVANLASVNDVPSRA